jgi:hypothetical protein
MKTTIKKNLIIIHDRGDWEIVKEKLVAEHGVTILMRHKMKRDLGFTVREHQGLMPALIKKDPTRMYYQDQIHLDFYNESSLSWFQLRYL